MEPKPPSPLVPILITVALYLSGLFSIFTPLPIVYSFLRFKEGAFLRVVFPAATALFFLYVIALLPLHTFYSNYPQWSWLLSFPGGALLSLITVEGAVAFGMAYFSFFVLVAFSIYKVLLAPTKVTLNLARVSVGFLVAAGFAFFLAGLSAGESPVAFLDRYFRASLTEAISLTVTGSLSSGEAAFFQENIDSLIFYSILFTPSFLFCSILTMILLNLVIGKRVFGPLIQGATGPLLLTQWSLPFSFVWGVIVLLALLLANSFFLKTNLLLGLAGNGLIVAAFLYYLQGVAVVAAFFEKKNVRPPFRIMGYAFLILFFQILGFVVVALGFFDPWFDFRKLGPGKGEKSG